ncbi:Uncharacterised protein [Bordetella pertussis]|nr:Uncharacterised protein [Bordetella pertussis]
MTVMTAGTSRVADRPACADTSARRQGGRPAGPPAPRRARPAAATYHSADYPCSSSNKNN